MSEQAISEKVGTRLLFENERVRVWDLQLAPGQSTGMHRHVNDYLYVVIGDGSLQAADAEGNRGEARDRQVVFNALEGGMRCTRRLMWGQGRGGISSSS